MQVSDYMSNDITETPARTGNIIPYQFKNNILTLIRKYFVILYLTWFDRDLHLAFAGKISFR
jgi:hypothetical protein